MRKAKVENNQFSYLVSIRYLTDVKIELLLLLLGRLARNKHQKQLPVLQTQLVPKPHSCG